MSDDRRRPVSERLANRSVPADNGCILWIGHVDDNGYPRLGKRWAHRVAYEEANGPIPPGLTVDHLCRRPLCINPVHMEAVTQDENNKRGTHPNHVAAASGTCTRGHPVGWSPTTGRRLKCNVCARARLRGEL